MKLSRKQFELLVFLTEINGKLTQRQIQEKINYSLGTVNKVFNELTELGLINDGMVTSKGYQVLEKYRAKRAIFIAAGFGSRLVPVTLDTPKPMVSVNGTRIIDTLIDSCLKAGITEIYIVRGYLAEKFDDLLDKYPMIKFLENPYFNEANNISSAYIARHLMENAYVLESDLLVSNPSIIKKYHYTSDVLGIYKEVTDDWCFDSRKGFVTEEKIGGKDCYQMVGIYYWNKEDGKRLAGDLEKAYLSPGGKERYWETVPNQLFRGKYKVRIIPCNENDVIEIDTFNELKEIDKSYVNYKERIKK